MVAVLVDIGPMDDTEEPGFDPRRIANLIDSFGQFKKADWVRSIASSGFLLNESANR